MVKKIIAKSIEILKSAFSHLKLFQRLMLYKIALIDLIFISVLLILGNVSSWFQKTLSEGNISILATVTIGILVLITSFYVMLKILFYKLIRKQIHFWRIVLNQLTAFVIIYFIMDGIYFLLRKIIMKAVVQEHSNIVRLSLLIVLIYLGYILLICVQKHDHEKFFTMLRLAFLELKVPRNYSFFLFDILLLVPTYIVYQLLVWLHQALLIFANLPMETLNITFDYSVNFISLLLIAIVMAVNKFIIFGLDKPVTKHIIPQSHSEHSAS